MFIWWILKLLVVFLNGKFRKTKVLQYKLNKESLQTSTLQIIAITLHLMKQIKLMK